MTAKPASLRWPIAAALLAASAAQAAEPTHAAAEPAAQTESGVRVYIDPATGKTREATPSERAEEARLSAAATQSQRKGKGPTVTKRADGTVRATDLDGSFMESVLVTRAADGSMQYQFVSGDATDVDPAQLPKAEDK